MPKLSARIGKRHALEGAAAGVVVLGLLLWWLLPLGDKPPSGSITISTGNQAGVYYEYARLLKGELSKDMPDLDVTLRQSNGSQENVARVADRKATFAIAAADAVGMYDSRHAGAANELRAVARLYDDYLQLVVPADSPVTSVAGLRGKRVGTGLEGSGVRLMADRVLDAAGIDPDRDITAMDEGIDSGPEHLREGRIDAFFWSGGVPTKGLQKLFSASGEFRFVPIPADLVAKMHQRDEETRFYRATNMPEDAYPKVQDGKTVPTVAVANLLITRADTKSDLAEWMTKTVIKSRDEIGHHVHSAQLVDLRTAIYTDPLGLHAGARRYYLSVKL
ncbi:TAXI family TRAP transporter solute-binding subunit [Streptomyces roseirectus]|uniref:TAXI family TRAP transporter solute-binding subunit n=1 Tax=Streptomyces roseirectus TaxID=2768066 RepID=A0A7H0IAI7_9ACTN|nr:TAXI family TRAP transporter solute-binding subunit [Streptomyces roseirectus]QNP69803.1 TAXI family TRAP transporter solute-binding subunit [Streptomyces roseirectus]